MCMFRIRITMGDRSCGRLTAQFASAGAAICQVLTDYPDARSVSALCVRPEAA